MAKNKEYKHLAPPPRQAEISHRYGFTGGIIYSHVALNSFQGLKNRSRNEFGMTCNENRFISTGHCEVLPHSNGYHYNESGFSGHCEVLPHSNGYQPLKMVFSYCPHGVLPHSNGMKKAAFTLAEVLTTLVIIGVISVITLPILNSSVDDKVFESQKKVFLTKFNDGMHRMQLKGDLAIEYDSTEDFVNAMKKHFNFSKVCKNDNLKACFGNKIKRSKKDTLYNLQNIRTSDQINIAFEEPSDVMGLVFNDGTRALIAYDTECVITSKYDIKADVTGCIAMYYDIDGSSGNGILGEDIAEMNVGEKEIDWENVEILSFPDFTPSQCESAKERGASIIECSEENNNDGFASAAYKCFSLGKRMATPRELTQFAEALYDYPISDTGTTSNLTPKNSQLLSKICSATAPSYASSSCHIKIIAKEVSATTAAIRVFEKNQTSYETRARKATNNGNIGRVICMDK